MALTSVLTTIMMLFILFTILTVVITRHTNSPFKLITTYYVRLIYKVWTSYFIIHKGAINLHPYLYTPLHSLLVISCIQSHME